MMPLQFQSKYYMGLNSLPSMFEVFDDMAVFGNLRPRALVGIEPMQQLVNLVK